METQTLYGLMVSVAAPWLLELVKRSALPFMEQNAPRLNRWTAMVASLAVTVGIDWHFDGGVLTVTGLQFPHILELALSAGVNFAVQELVYRKFLNGTGGPSARMPWIVLLALAFTLSACASSQLPRPIVTALVQTDDAIHDAIVVTVSTGNKLCDAHVLDAPACIRFNQALIPVITEADAFNRAVASNSSAQVPTMILSLERLTRDLEALLPTPDERAAVMAVINNARAHLRALAGGR